MTGAYQGAIPVEKSKISRALSRTSAPATVGGSYIQHLATVPGPFGPLSARITLSGALDPAKLFLPGKVVISKVISGSKFIPTYMTGSAFTLMHVRFVLSNVFQSDWLQLIRSGNAQRQTLSPMSPQGFDNFVLLPGDVAGENPNTNQIFEIDFDQLDFYSDAPASINGLVISGAANVRL